MEWISVNDAFPLDYEYVLVCASKKGTDVPCPISIARCYKGVWEMLNHSEQSNSVACSDLTCYMYEDEITHWMPLPPPPGE